MVIPAYNTEKTLEKTYNDILPEIVDEIIVVDDVSSDRTAEIAEKVGVTVIVHSQNRGYTANQETC